MFYGIWSMPFLHRSGTFWMAGKIFELITRRTACGRHRVEKWAYGLSFFLFFFSLATDRLVDNACVTTAEETEGLWLRSFARTVYK